MLRKLPSKALDLGKTAKRLPKSPLTASRLLPTYRLVHATESILDSTPKQSDFTSPRFRITNCDGEERIDALKDKTQRWLLLPAGRWSRKDEALGHSLLEDWLRLPHSHPDRAPWSTQVLNRWIEEVRELTPSAHWTSENSDLVGMLHRVLFAWKVALEEGLFLDSCVFEHVVGWLDDFEALYQERQDPNLRPQDQTYTMMLQVLALQCELVPDAGQEALDLLELCMRRRQRGGKLPPKLVLAWNACLHVLAKCSKQETDAPKKAENLLDGMIHGTVEGSTGRFTAPRPDAMSFSIVLNAWANSPQKGAPERADALLEKMIPNQRLPNPTEACYTAVLKALAKSSERGSAHRAQSMLQIMLQSNDVDARPSHLSFFFALAAWANASAEPNAAENAETLLDSMQQLYNETGDSNAQPTVSCYSLVIVAWSKRPNSGSKVSALLQKMEAAQLTGPEEDSIVAAYVAAICAWAKTAIDDQAPERADELLEVLLQRFASENNNRILLKACAETIRSWAQSSRAEAPERASAVLDRMKVRGVEPDTVILNNLLNAFAQRGDAHSATKTFEEMDASYARGNTNVRPSAVTYTTVITALARSKHYPQAAKVATELLEELIEVYSDEGTEILRPNERTFSAVIFAWSNSGEVDCAEQAERILWDMSKLPESLGVGSSRLPQPNTAICNNVLRAWSRSSNIAAPGRAEELLAWMQDQVKSGANLDVKPDRISYNYVLKAWSESRRENAVLYIEAHLKQMASVSSNRVSLANAFSYNCLLKALKNSNRKDKAAESLNLLEQMVSSRSYDLHSFHVVLASCLPSRSGINDCQDSQSNVAASAFGLLKSIEDPSFRISQRTIALILRSYCTSAVVDEKLLQQVVEFGYEKVAGFDSRRLLRSMQQELPDYEYRGLSNAEQKAKENLGLL